MDPLASADRPLDDAAIHLRVAVQCLWEVAGGERACLFHLHRALQAIGEPPAPPPRSPAAAELVKFLVALPPSKSLSLLDERELPPVTPAALEAAAHWIGRAHRERRAAEGRLPWPLRHAGGIRAFVIAFVTVIYFGASVGTGSWSPLHWARIRLGPIAVVSATQDWGSAVKNADPFGNPLVIGGKLFPEGIATHAHSRVELAFDRAATTFKGACGYPDYMNRARIRCAVYVGDKEVFLSGVLGANARLETFAVPLGGARGAVLEVRAEGESNTYAHAAWVGLTLE